uniref:Uncharacterized protein n=1 Tax=Trypanosoma congolense (strain IL3000) TaxID=1068625 RepID=G0UR71_TRYCI|nr:hypothetical protein, unlikely [Trypanosoma congolense IL3000]
MQSDINLIRVNAAPPLCFHLPFWLPTRTHTSSTPLLTHPIHPRHHQTDNPPTKCSFQHIPFTYFCFPLTTSLCFPPFNASTHSEQFFLPPKHSVSQPPVCVSVHRL